ncbi:MAG: hypothetical protein RLY89_963, partial [Bacteroidota bacterium]
MKQVLLALSTLVAMELSAQTPLSPETLWSLGKVSGLGISKDKQQVLFSVNFPDVEANKGNVKTFRIGINGGNAELVTNPDIFLTNPKISPDGKWLLSADAVKIKPVFGSDFYPSLTKSNVQIYESLNYRHWDTWEDGKFDHVFLNNLVDGKPGQGLDLMKGEPFDCPTKPFGGDDDYVWNPDGKHVVYVTKKSYGTAYA